MKLLISFDPYQKDWYVGELYQEFFNFLKNKPGLEVNFINIKDFSKKYKENIDINSLSIFSPYNLIITNEITNKTFIHSFSDYAPAMMDDITGILNFDVSGFSCSSNLSEENFLKYSLKYKIIPSFYILEKYSDLYLIEEYKDKKNKINKCYFNGLCYSERLIFKKIFENNDYINFIDKRDLNKSRTKKEYYNDLSEYKFGISLNGAAKICYRDLECFGLGTLCLRENLNIITKDPIINGKHYITIIDDEIKKMINDENNYKLINEKINDKLNEIINNNLYDEIIENSKIWFQNNCLPNKQKEILFSFLEESNII